MEEREAKQRNRRTGQTLAEFAITLPILLLLLFGIIEFGRIFQAWVTLQNAARSAARYASTGVYDKTLYTLDLEIHDIEDTTWPGDLNSIVPCMVNEQLEDNPTGDGAIEAANAARTARNLAQRGVPVTYPSGNFPGFNSLDPIQAYQDGPESIYATYYGGDDCDPSDSEDQNRRKDLARILSIWNEARRGAAGLGLSDRILPEPQLGTPFTYDYTTNPPTWTLTSGHYPDPSTVPWYQVWDRPLPDASNHDQLRYSDERGWFDVMMCSSRVKLDNSNMPSVNEVDNRFEFPPELSTAADPRAPVCLLQEDPVGGSTLNDIGWTHNADRPWLDAGGPGDTVYIVVTFNHPLITPLGISSYLPLQARRVAVNEAFRSPRAVPPSYDLPEPPEILATDTPTPTETPSETFTPSMTPTASETPTASSTPTEIFQCNYVTASNISFGLNSIQVTITNSLAYSTYLTRALVYWAKPTGYSGMVATSMTLNGQTIWTGSDSDPYTDVGNDVTVGPSTPAPGHSPEYVFGNSANLELHSGANTWTLTFANAPSPLSNIPASVFNNTSFYFDDLNATTDCLSQFNTATPTATYTLPPDVSPTPTATVDCVASPIQISPLMFATGDMVRFDITNSGSTSIDLIGFQIAWNKHGSSTMRLSEVWGGGSYPNLVSNSLPLWYAGANQDANPPTTGGTDASGLTGREGTWQNILTLNPGETVPLYILFGGGANGTLPHDFPGVAATDFSASFFRFSSECYEITQRAPTPLPSATPTNTYTPTNTFTPSRTPTNTFTPSRTPTPTNTFTATNTFTPTLTFTPTSTPTTTVITIDLTGVCNTTGDSTFTISTTGPTIPSGSIRYRIYQNGTTQVASGTINQTIPPSRTRTRNDTYGQITFTIYQVNLPAYYTLATPLPLSYTVTCIVPTATNTRTPTRTYTPSNTPTNTFTPTRTLTPTRTFTPTNTRTPTNTFTPSNTPPPTNTHTPTRTYTPTNTATNTPPPAQPTRGDGGSSGG